MHGEIIEYGIKETKGRECHKGQWGQHCPRPQRVHVREGE